MGSEEVDLSSSANLEAPQEQMDTDDGGLPDNDQMSQEELRQKKADDKDFLTGQVSNFLALKDKWTMSNILPAFNGMAGRLHTREQTRGELFPNAFVSLELMPAIVYFIASQLFHELPDSCKLTKNKEEEFALCILSIMDQIKYPRGLSVVQNFEDLLDPYYDERWTRALGDELVDHLRSTAELKLEQYTASRNSYSSEEHVEFDEAFSKANPEFNGQRLYNVSRGHFDCGFNTSSEERYVYFDMRYLLFPSQSDIKCEKWISTATNNYLMRSARELVDLELGSEDQNPALMKHLQELLDRGHPSGYSVLQPTE